MEISELTNNAHAIIAPEPKKPDENKVSDIKDENANTAVSGQETTPSVSEILTIQSGGTVTHSIDGDVVELSADAVNTVAVKSSAEAGGSAKPSAETAETTATATAVSESATDSEDSTTKAITMLLQGSSDSAIKEKTGISQQELDKLKQSFEKKPEQESD